MNFNPQDYMLKLKGKDYLPVAARVAWMRAEHPDWGVITEPHTIEEEYAIFRCKVIDGNGQVLATATKVEDRRGFPDFVEKAETGAVGRALALCGYGTIQGGDFFEGEEEVVDSPVQRRSPHPLGASDQELNERAARLDAVTARIIAASMAEGSRVEPLATVDGKLILSALRKADALIAGENTDRIFTEDRPSLTQLEQFATSLERYNTR